MFPKIVFCVLVTSNIDLPLSITVSLHYNNTKRVAPALLVHICSATNLYAAV